MRRVKNRQDTNQRFIPHINNMLASIILSAPGITSDLGDPTTCRELKQMALTCISDDHFQSREGSMILWLHTLLCHCILILDVL